MRADILYTYQKGRFEADVILRERPPAPDAFGLNNQTTMLEMATELTETTEPKKTELVLGGGRRGIRLNLNAHWNHYSPLIRSTRGQFVPDTMGEKSSIVFSSARLIFRGNTVRDN